MCWAPARAGLDPNDLPARGMINVSEDINPDKRPKRWKDIWSAGHGVSDIDEILPTAELIAKMKAEYQAAVARVTA